MCAYKPMRAPKVYKDLSSSLVLANVLKYVMCRCIRCHKLYRTIFCANFTFSFLPFASCTIGAVLSPSKYCWYLLKRNGSNWACNIQTFNYSDPTPANYQRYVKQKSERSQRSLKSLLPVLPPGVLIPIEVAINHGTTAVYDYHWLSKLIRSQISNSSHFVLNGTFYASNSHSSIWLQKHFIHIQTIYSPSSHLLPASRRQVVRKIKHRLVQMQRAQLWHYMLLERLDRWKTTWGTPAIQRSPYPSSLHYNHVCTRWVFLLFFTSQIRPAI